ncbi:MAG: FkbM family methyltransferase [Bradyrhizobium sp.]|nr:FkbM family methyltransferase [Pseudomonadota bacterium]MDE2473358.1 FkbM family methyltransferase [Bradyrhizobium sp.]
MSTTRRAKKLLKEAFPSMWVRWQLSHWPKSSEQELHFLDRIIPKDAVTVDVGANLGLYTRKLSKLSSRVHAFEPSHEMAELLRRTSAPNVRVHEVALSDQAGDADLFIPQDQDKLIYGLSSLESRSSNSEQRVVSTKVSTARLDAIVREDVAFIKVDVEGHELNVLDGAAELLDRSQPVFLVEAEDRHRDQATRLLFEFFAQRSYRGYFIRGASGYPIEQFRVDELQDERVLLCDGGRQTGKYYINNFFFFPRHLDGESMLS